MTSSGQTSSLTNFCIQSSFSWNSGSVAKSQLIKVSFSTDPQVPWRCGGVLMVPRSRSPPPAPAVEGGGPDAEA